MNKQADHFLEAIASTPSQQEGPDGLSAARCGEHFREIQHTRVCTHTCTHAQTPLQTVKELSLLETFPQTKKGEKTGAQPTSTPPSPPGQMPSLCPAHWLRPHQGQSPQGLGPCCCSRAPRLSPQGSAGCQNLCSPLGPLCSPRCGHSHARRSGPGRSRLSLRATQ